MILSRKGLNRMERELEKLQTELAEKRLYTNEVARESGSCFNNNYDFEQALADEQRILNSVRHLQNQILSATIIDEEISYDIVHYGAKVKLLLMLKDEKEIFQVLFSDSNEESELETVSLNSPLGKLIFKQKVGFKGQYTVDENTFTVEILALEY